VETSRLGNTSNVVTSSHGDISNVAAWGHYQSRATQVFLKKVLRCRRFGDSGEICAPSAHSNFGCSGRISTQGFPVSEAWSNGQIYLDNSPKPFTAVL
jgi:hypothetical protein